MVKLNSELILEILFLNRHPKGPKMQVNDIADYVKISEKEVNICLKKFESHDIFQINKTDSDLEDELNSIYLGTWSSTSSSTWSMSTSEPEITIKYERYIDFCKFEWFEKLNDVLQISTNDIKKANKPDESEVIKKLYSTEGFSKDRHNTAMKLIDQQLKFKTKIEPLKFQVQRTVPTTPTSNMYFGNNPYNIVNIENFEIPQYQRTVQYSSYSYYCPDVALVNIILNLEDMCFSTPIILDKSDQSVSTEKYIKMCKSEFEQEMCEKLNFTKNEYESLETLLKMFYSAKVFTEERHTRMMKSIGREQKFKAKVSKIFVPGSSQSYYRSMHSVKNLELLLEEFLNI